MVVKSDLAGFGALARRLCHVVKERGQTQNQQALRRRLFRRVGSAAQDRAVAGVKVVVQNVKAVKAPLVALDAGPALQKFRDKNL